MTSPESASPSRPAKAAGFALLGVAAVALVIGVISLFAGDSDAPPAAEGTTSAPPAATSSGSTASEQPPASTSASNSASSAPASTPSSAPPAATSSSPATSAVPPPPVTQTGVAKVPVRVYNNSTVTGLASKASDEVRANGWTVAETGNYSSGTIPTTTVYFRPGTDEEASARELAGLLRARVEPRFDGIQSAAAGIILIVTNDFQGASKNK